MSKYISKIEAYDNECLITISNMPGNLSAITDVLGSISQAGISIDMINLTPLLKGNAVSFSFTLGTDDLSRALGVLGAFKDKYPKLTTEIITNNTKICLSDKNMPETCGVGAKLFQILAENNIETRLVTTSAEDISVLVSDAVADTAIELITNEMLK